MKKKKEVKREEYGRGSQRGIRDGGKRIRKKKGKKNEKIRKKRMKLEE